MIAKGNLHANGVKLVRYILTAEPGERVEQAGSHGFDFFSEDPVEAARLMQRMADVTTRCEKAWFHTQTRLPPGEALSPEQWEIVRTREEKRLGFTGLPCIWSFHIDEASGERHLHAAWFRVDVEQERAVDPGLFKLRLKELCRTLEKEFALREVSNHREAHDRASVAGRNEVEEARRLGTDVRAIRTAILDCYERSDSGKAFKAALEARGLMLANGDRRDCFVMIDEAGGHHALNKKLTGQTLAATRARLGDLDRAQLPSVDQAKVMQAELQAARGEPVVAPLFDRDAANADWMEKVEAAAIATEEAARARRDGRHTGSADAGTEVPDAAARGAYAALQPEQPAAPGERPLGKTAGAIRLAWSLSRGPAELAEALAARGVRLAKVTPEEARASERRAEFAKAIGNHLPAWRAEEIVAVDGYGTAYRLNERTTGQRQPEIRGWLVGFDRDSLLSVAETKDIQRAAALEIWKAERKAEWEKTRPANWIESRIAGCAEEVRISGASVQLDDDGHRVSRIDALVDQFRPAGEWKTTPARIYGAEAIAARLDEAGIAFARATEDDIPALDALREQEGFDRVSGLAHRRRHFAQLEVGELAAVTRAGDVYRINPLKLGDAAQLIADPLPSVTETRARFESEREQIADLWEQRRGVLTDARLQRAVEHESYASRLVSMGPASENDGMRSADESGGRLLGGIASMIGSFVNRLADFIAPPAPPTKAEQIAAQQNELEVSAARQAAQERHETIAQARRAPDLAERHVDLVWELDDPQFRARRAQRDKERERELER